MLTLVPKKQYGCDLDLDPGLHRLHETALSREKCRLVIPSACDTVLGELQSGVAGLRPVFQMDGAQSVQATVWQIPDAQTVPLMKTSLRTSADGRGKVDALWAAQLEPITAHRVGRSAAHPFYWDAFTITGCQ